MTKDSNKFICRFIVPSKEYGYILEKGKIREEMVIIEFQLYVAKLQFNIILNIKERES